MLVGLAAAAAAFGCRPIVGVFRDSRGAHLEVADHARSRGLDTEIVPCNGRLDCKAIGRIREIVKRRRVDVLHTHGYKADICGYAASWPRRAALVSTCHNWPDRRPAMRAYAVMDRLVLRRFDGVAAAAGPVAAVLKRAGIPGAVALANGVELERFQQAAPTLRDRIPEGCDQLVGFIGRLVPAKGGEFLIRAAQKVLAGRPRAAFVFVGEGPSGKEWQALAERLGISRHVLFTGARNDMPGVYASLDVLVLPSLIEATPMCLLEAMAAGRPVIATRVGSVPEVVLPDITGLLLEPGDAGGLAEAILRLLNDLDLARRMGEQGRAHVEQRFSAQAMARAYIDLYRRALARSRARSRWDHV